MWILRINVDKSLRQLIAICGIQKKYLVNSVYAEPGKLVYQFRPGGINKSYIQWNSCLVFLIPSSKLCYEHLVFVTEIVMYDRS